MPARVVREWRGVEGAKGNGHLSNEIKAFHNLSNSFCVYWLNTSSVLGEEA